MAHLEECSKVHLVSNDSGIRIERIIHGINDKAVFRWFTGEELGRKCTSKLRYNAKSEAYIESFGSRYYIKDFV